MAKAITQITDPKFDEDIVIKRYLDKKITNMFNLIYPIGSIYMSVSPTNPSTLFGGTWEEWGSGRVPLAFGNNGTTNYSTVEATGGFEKVVLSVANLPSHTHGSRSLTGGWDYHGSETGSPARSPIGIVGATTVTNQYRTPGTSTSGAASSKSLTINATHEHDSVGSGTSHDNMQPYIVCYMWKRTA